MGICDRDEVRSPPEPLSCVVERRPVLYNRSKSEDLACAREETADSADIFFRALRRKSCPGLSKSAMAKHHDPVSLIEEPYLSISETQVSRRRGISFNVVWC